MSNTFLPSTGPVGTDLSAAAEFRQMRALSLIVVLEKAENIRRQLQTQLEDEGFAVMTAAGGQDVLDRLQDLPTPRDPQVLLLDQADGLEAPSGPFGSPPVIRLSCSCEIPQVVEVLRRGPVVAADWEKAFSSCQCEGSTGRATSASVGGESYVEEVAPDTYFVAASAAMKQVRTEALRIAEADVPVLLLGESGTGKEILSLLIRKHSPRHLRSFLKVNCAALPSELLESELFGFEAGAFTGAVRSKPGKFELCNGGTILLDEIGEMPPCLQAKLLHVLQDGAFSRLGGKTTIRTDVRILAATNVEVSRALAEGRLREDLYYRLNAFTLVLPPLRQRPEEIPVLLDHCLTRLSQRYGRPLQPMSPALVEKAKTYSWPGNLRELENFVKRYIILGSEQSVLQTLQERPVPAAGRQEPSPPALGGGNGLKSLVRSLKDEAERKAIAQALGQANWNRKEAARILSISYKALLYKIRQYGLDRSQAALPA